MKKKQIVSISKICAVLACLLQMQLLVANPPPPFVFEEGVVFATATDTEHYPLVLSLIASIQRYHAQNLRAIAVFDLGLEPHQRTHLNSIAHTTVYPIEPIHPHLFEKFRTRPTIKGKPVRGLYTWKPVVIKQALEIYPYVYYLDAALTLKQPVDLLFEYLLQNRYLFYGCGHSIYPMCTQKAAKIFNLDDPSRQWVYSAPGLAAGIQGLTNSMLNCYVLPIYDLAHDITNFVDDGSAPGGFGNARHDQTLFSIQAHLLRLDVQSSDYIHHVTLNGSDFAFRLCDYIQTKPSWWSDAYD